ncbi:MAG: hypothetical protein AVDCRST_MAG93-353 [uncultured Chloroflexia bacterium]|uniref:Uncharacterized protein n=1 Tax=uncultured Chloroflexia bacterium TaxID=1672391 RepID=A0A6J4HBH0_9CHLR|nr:MAG: hypothetical protein AVDCRST_MAG93-353 [uncultured Chloroflexia bacterium]
MKVLRAILLGNQEPSVRSEAWRLLLQQDASCSDLWKDCGRKRAVVLREAAKVALTLHSELSHDGRLPLLRGSQLPASSACLVI